MLLYYMDGWNIWLAFSWPGSLFSCLFVCLVGWFCIFYFFIYFFFHISFILFLLLFVWSKVTKTTTSLQNSCRFYICCLYQCFFIYVYKNVCGMFYWVYVGLHSYQDEGVREWIRRLEVIFKMIRIIFILVFILNTAIV